MVRFPLGLAAAADGHVIATSNSGGAQALSLIDAGATRAVPTAAQNLFVGVTVANGTVYASGGNADRVYRFRQAGEALVHEDPVEAEPQPIHGAIQSVEDRNPTSQQPPAVVVGIPVPGYPGGSVADGRYLYVASTSSLTPAAGSACPGDNPQPACGRISIIDTGATPEKVVGVATVGLDAYELAVDAASNRLFVTNWADEAGRGNGNGTGTVSVVDVKDPSAPKEVAVVPVGHHPTALQLSRDATRLFVANTNDDTLSVLDVSSTAAYPSASTVSLQVPGGSGVGAHPDAFALSPDGRTLFVAQAGLNAVEVLDGQTAQRVGVTPRYIPTGWYPSALLVTPGAAVGYQLWVANAKGRGFGPGYNATVFQQGTTTGGTVTSIDLPVKPKQERAWSDEVATNDRFRTAPAGPCAAPERGIAVSQVLCPPKGAASPIKHVLYIVAENKTFDQYFGDIGAGYDADPSYAIYGNTVTPNQHKLAAQYALGDRFYSDAEVSVTGHSWTSGGVATDHNEKTWAADYDQGLRGNHTGADPLRPSISSKVGNDGDDELQDPEGGYVFEAFKKAGAKPPTQAGPGALSMAIYGEHTARSSGTAFDAYKATGQQQDGTTKAWKDGDLQYFDTCRAQMFIRGHADQSGPLARDSEQDRGCEGRVLDPQFTLAGWNAAMAAGKGDTMPSFMYMSLPVNHTVGTNWARRRRHRWWPTTTGPSGSSWKRCRRARSGRRPRVRGAGRHPGRR